MKQYTESIQRAVNPMPNPRYNITVVTYNRLGLTRLCLASLLRFTGDDARIHVVDNGSSDGTHAFLDALARQDARVRVILLRRNMGVSVAANTGWAAADADYYVKLDNDMLIQTADWLAILRNTVERNPEVGMVGYQLCAWHTTQHVRLASGDAFIESDCCGGACVLLPRAAHQRFGFWNEDYGRYGFEDLEYGGRVTLGGYRIGYRMLRAGLNTLAMPREPSLPNMKRRRKPLLKVKRAEKNCMC